MPPVFSVVNKKMDAVLQRHDDTYENLCVTLRALRLKISFLDCFHALAMTRGIKCLVFLVVKNGYPARLRNRAGYDDREYRVALGS